MTKTENRRVLQYYSEILGGRVMAGRMDRDKYDRCYRKLREWDVKLQMKRGTAE